MTFHQFPSPVLDAICSVRQTGVPALAGTLRTLTHAELRATQLALASVAWHQDLAALGREIGSTDPGLLTEVAEVILDACSDTRAWSPADVRALLQVIVDNYAGRAEVIAPMVIRAIESLDVVDRAELTLQIVAARTANDHWSSATRRRLQAFVSATAEDHWSSEARRLLGPFATALQDIDIPLPYYFADSSSFGRLVRFGDHGVDIEPSLAASLARLAAEAAARPKRRGWEPEFDSMVDLAGVRELLALVVESAMAATASDE